MKNLANDGLEALLLETAILAFKWSLGPMTLLMEVLAGRCCGNHPLQVSGPPGSGKTQFCLMLSVQSALPEAVGGCGSPVIYVDTEGAFSAER